MNVKHVVIGFIDPFGVTEKKRTYAIDDVITPNGNLKRSFSSIISSHVGIGGTLSLTPIADYGNEYTKTWAELSVSARAGITNKLNMGHRVGAVKTYREHTNVSLKEGVDFIDWLIQERR